MQYIYIDESGDLGFDFTKKGTSRYFLVAAIVTESPRLLRKAVLEVFKQFKGKFKRKHPGVFHATHESNSTQKKMCNIISGNECSIRVVYIDKLHNKLEQDSIYEELVLKHVDLCGEVETTLVLSRRYVNKHQNLELIKYLKYKNNVKIIIEIPAREKILQLADTVSWVFFNKYEKRSQSFYRMIESKLEYEVSL